MHTQHSCLSTLDPPARATFERQLAESLQTPGLHPLLSHGREDLFPRFARYYDHLCHLPRRARRALQRQWKRSLSAIALLLALGQVPAALAAQIDVGVGGCTLVDAITAANTDIATGGCPAGSGADVIAVKHNVTLRAVNNTTDGPNGLPSVTGPITINGNAHTLQRSTVSGTPDFRLLHVADSGDLTLNKITLSNGRAPYSGYYCCEGGGLFNRGTVVVNDSTVSGNTAYVGNGGGLANQGGTLTITDSTVSGNTANYRSGGGVFNSGTLTITNSTVSNNWALFPGGGVSSSEGTLTITDSTVSGNTADDDGGGVANRGGILTLVNSTVSDNSASFDGGGVSSSFEGTLTITNSTISGNSAGVCGGVKGSVGNITDSTVSDNTAVGGGGGVCFGGGPITNSVTNSITNSTISGNTATVAGGVFAIYGKTLTVANSTVSDNTAEITGGGVFNLSHLTLTNSTVSGNTAGDKGGGVYNRNTLTLTRSLISGNAGPNGTEGYDYSGPDLATAVYADNFNLFGTNGDAGVVGFTPGSTDIIPAAGVMLAEILDPLLADNGGPTETHALVFGSPASDASPVDKDCALTDQRGVFRPQGPACDIGAFEVEVEADPFASPTPTGGCTVNGVPNQSCIGTLSNDTIVGTTGNDVIAGLDGRDVLRGRNGDDRIVAGGDNDDLIGNSGNDLLAGSNGDDTLLGNEGSDTLLGEAGTDVIQGGTGDDFIDGGAGTDNLQGQQGTDTCVNGEQVSGCP